MKRFCINYLFLVAITFTAFILPGFLFSLYNDYIFRFELNSVLALGAAALIFPLVRPRVFIVCIFGIFALMECIQFSHLYYFNKPLNIFSLHLMFIDFGEVAQTALGEGILAKGIIHVCIVVFTYLILSLFYFKISRKTNFIATALAIFALSILPYKALYKTDRLSSFSPKNDSISLYNSLRTFSGYFFLYLRMPKVDIPTYPEYTYDYKDVGDRNVILILGESTNANHMGLLGYERNTNPLLSQWAKNDKNFIAKRAISSAVLTRVAVPSFLNIAYKPDNIKHILNEKTHLIYLAKKAGFKTFYYSAQTISELSDVSSENLDEFFTREDYYFEHKKLGDLLVLEKLKENKSKFLYGKNFLIMHQRNAHSPYQRGYRAYKKADVFKPMTRENTYDNAMIFNDYFIFSVFEIFQELSKKSNIPTYVIFVPDHAEAMGEMGRNNQAEYGHSFLSENVANIPIFATSFNVKNNDFISNLRQSSFPTHYEIAKLLAREIGYEIHNTLEEPNVFYINGVDISGNAGYIKVLRDKDKVNFEYFNKEN